MRTPIVSFVTASTTVIAVAVVVVGSSTVEDLGSARQRGRKGQGLVVLATVARDTPDSDQHAKGSCQQ